jgi:hypothetical protein
MAKEDHEDPIAAEMKLEFLMRHPVPRRVLGHEPTMVSFSDKLGVARKTLIDQRDNGRLSSYVQSTLAAKLKFRLDWPDWLTGNVEDFRNRYCHEHGSDADAPTRIHDPAVKLRSERLVPAEKKDRERPNLASLSLFLQQAGPGQSLPVSVELVCQPEPVGNFEIAVYRGRLEIDPGAAEIPLDPPPLATDGPATMTRGNRTVTLQRYHASGAGRVAWTVSAKDGPIGVLRLDDDQDLCLIGEPADGDIITAVLHVYVKDLDLAEPDPDDEADDRADPYSFLRPDGKPLSPKKRQIIKGLILKDELGPAPEGWHALAEDRRRLVRDGE